MADLGNLAVHRTLDCSSVNGPGDRAVIWVQGCVLGCPECWNPTTHKIEKQDTRIQYLVDWILSLKGLVDGVTFTGGEPMHQVRQLGDLAYAVHREWSNCSFGMFTGYSLNELEKGNYKQLKDIEKERLKALDGWYNKDGQFSWDDGKIWDWHVLKDHLDFAVMGRYVKTLPSDNPMCGSSNQEIILFPQFQTLGDYPTPRYKMSDFKPQQMELQISEGGLVEITGFPRTDLFEERVV